MPLTVYLNIAKLYFFSFQLEASSWPKRKQTRVVNSVSVAVIHKQPRIPYFENCSRLASFSSLCIFWIQYSHNIFLQIYVMILPLIWDAFLYFWCVTFKNVWAYLFPSPPPNIPTPHTFPFSFWGFLVNVKPNCFSGNNIFKVMGKVISL